MKNNKSIDDVMVCPYCDSDDCCEFSTDEFAFEEDCTGHYYVICSCNRCEENFKLYAEFKYSVTKTYIR